MKFQKIFLLFFVQIFFSSCCFEKIWEWLNPDDKCTLQQCAYEGDNLHLDGFYYHQIKEGQDFVHVESFILYRNGVVMGALGDSCLDKAERSIIRMSKDVSRINGNIDNWGLFEVSDSSISLEYYLPSMYGHHTYLMRGTILNDSTFHMTQGKKSNESGFSAIDRIYNFHKLEAKPDSTNKYFR